MHFVIYVAPWFSEFATSALAATAYLPGVRLGVVSGEPLEALASDVRARVASHWRVDDVFDSRQLIGAARELARREGPIHRIFTAQEHIQTEVAEARAALGVEGMSMEAARNFRDKARMKRVLRAAGLPCARHSLAASPTEAWRFADEVGYPLVAKPPAGAGSQETSRLDGPDDLRAVLAGSPPSDGVPLLLEEFITGEEHSFDTFTLRGVPVFHTLTHYSPAPLDALRNTWIQWTVLLPREVDDSRYDDIRAAAFQALEALGMGTGMSHLEWFRRADGSIAISEVAARPPGAQITTLISRANDIDTIGAWARLMVYEAFDPPERRYAAGAAYLRAQGHGERIVAIRGLQQAWQEIGPLVTDSRLPEVGRPPAKSYDGDGFVIVRHPETEVVRQALSRLITLIRVELG
jgi:biotin carboxylase